LCDARRAAGFVLAFVALIISAVVGASVFGLMHFRSAEASGASMSLSVSQNGPVTCSGGGIHRKCKVLATKSFTLGVTASVPPPRGYTAYQVVLQFTSGLNTGAGETKQEVGLVQHRDGFQALFLRNATDAREVDMCRHIPTARVGEERTQRRVCGRRRR